jgi:superfamily II DNA or RNA helicase/intein/homing endonuclease
VTEDADAGPESDDETEEPLAALHGAIERSGSAVLTTGEVARHLERSREETQRLLADLERSGKVLSRDVSQDPVVWYPTDWDSYVDRERFVVFPDRRQVVVDRPAQFTRAQLSQFARLTDANGDEGYVYEIQEGDIWGSPYDDLEALLGTVRDVLPDRYPDLEGWIEDQWRRAHQFTLKTHEDGYVVLEAASDDLMGNVARQKLDDGHLRAPISETESWVAEDATAEVKRILYEAGYPVQDDRDLDSGAALEVRVDLELRDYQHDWVARFMESKSGVLVGPPGSGKTVAALGILSRVGGETLILVPSRELVRQWRDELLAHTSLDESQVGEYHGGTKDVRPVTIATYQTAGMGRHRHLFDDREWGLIVYDEVQHIPSDVYRRSTDLQTRHRLGLSVHGDTLVPFRRDGQVRIERISDFVSEYLDGEAGLQHVEDVETLGITDSGEVVWTPVTAAMRHENTSELYTVRASNGRKVTVTADHSLIVFDSERLEIVERKPKKLEDRHYLLQPRSVPDVKSSSDFDILSLVDEGYVLLTEDCPDSALEPLYEEQIGSNKDRYNWKSRRSLPISVFRDIELDRKHVRGVYVHGREYWVPPSVDMEDFGRLVGLYLADGAIDEHRVEFSAVDTELQSEVEAFEAVIRKIVPDAKPNRIENGEHCTTLRVPGPLANILRKLDLDAGARDKEVPPFILCSEEAQRGFLDGMVLGDGHRQHRDRNRESVTISTSSERLAQGINFVLSSQGFVGGNYRRTADVALREGEHDVVENNLVRFNPKNRSKTARNAMVPFSGRLRQALDSVERVPPGERWKTGNMKPITSGYKDRNRLNEEEMEVIFERSEISGIDWLADNDVAMLQVDSVERAQDTEYVYDLSTGTENFLGNHLFCHNSATPVREDDLEEDIYTLIGPPIGTDWDALFDEGFVAEPEVEIRYVGWGEEDDHRNQYVGSEGHERRQLAASNPAKIPEIERVLREHPTQKALVFVDYLEQGREIAAALDVPFISGETPHGRREALFQQFRDGSLSTLLVSRVGDEGIDLPDAEVAVVASGLGGSRRQGTQRAGRTMRPAGRALMYVLATRGTREEEFARRQMQHLARKGVRVREHTVAEDRSVDEPEEDADDTGEEPDDDPDESEDQPDEAENPG